MSNIQWTDETWNPVIGCRKVAAGCTNCYAETMSKRLAAMGQADYASILDDKGRFNGTAITRPEKLAAPFHWRKPRRVFVNSMSDLFHEDVPFEFIAAVFGVMAACPQHTFQLLTKRPERMREFFDWVDREAKSAEVEHPERAKHWYRFRAKHWYRFHIVQWEAARELGEDIAQEHLVGVRAMAKLAWPLPNVWLGVSVATQADADANIPLLLQVPSAIRFVSLEPQVESVDLRSYMETREWTVMHCRACGYVARGDSYVEERGMDDADFYCPKCGESSEEIEDVPGLDWVIQGGESGKGARPFDIAWAREVRDQCKAAGVPYFLKQLGAHILSGRGGDFDDPVCDLITPEAPGELMLKHPKGGDPSEWPMDLQDCREFPPHMEREAADD